MQTITAPAIRTTHYLVTAIVAAVVLAIVVTLGALRYAGGSNHSSTPSLTRAVPALPFESCRMLRPC